jgi:hypothetical protein
VIPANRKVALMVGSSRSAVQYVPGYRCHIGLSFDAAADGQYEVQYRYENNACAVRLYQLRVSPGGPVTRAPEPSARAYRAQQHADQCGFR